MLNPGNRSKTQGFTLIELMIALVIGAIIVMLAAPSFKNATSANLASTQANLLVSSINLARSEAVKRRTNVTICASTDQATCGGTDWTTGWIVRLDSDNSVLRAQEALKGNTAITYNVATAAVQYNSQGLSNLAADLEYTLTPDTCNGKNRRVVSISPTGRAGAEKDDCP